MIIFLPCNIIQNLQDFGNKIVAGIVLNINNVTGTYHTHAMCDRYL